MLLLIELSGESQEAAEQEIHSVVSVSPESKLIRTANRCAIVEGDLGAFSNLAFANRISEIIGSSVDLKDLGSVNLPSGNFYVRKIDSDGGGLKVSESEIGDVLNSKGRVTFIDPDFVLIAAHAGKWYLGVVRFERDKKAFRNRRAPMRPFFSPVSLDPKLARFMINLSRTRSGDIILDPFCGTGGILIEAGLMGRKVLGNDFSLQMVRGARMNLKYFGIKGEVTNLPISELTLQTKIAGIVTDLPYGRSSPLPGRKEDLYSTAIEKFSEFLQEGSFAIVMVHDPNTLGSNTHFKTVGVSAFRSHKSLTRYVVSLIRT